MAKVTRLIVISITLFTKIVALVVSNLERSEKSGQLYFFITILTEATVTKSELLLQKQLDLEP